VSDFVKSWIELLMN